MLLKQLKIPSSNGFFHARQTDTCISYYYNLRWPEFGNFILYFVELPH
jgi:hypothetical protein